MKIKVQISMNDDAGFRQTEIILTQEDIFKLAENKVMERGALYAKAHSAELTPMWINEDANTY